LFGGARPQSEHAADYLPALQRQPAQLDPAHEVTAGHTFVDTEAKPGQ
jgi:hypothetical protein